MKNVRKYLGDIRRTYKLGKRILFDKYFVETNLINRKELNKEIKRTEIINFFLKLKSCPSYLEIGVRNPKDNFDLIECENKYSVDPGKEFKSDQIQFELTSDAFFDGLDQGVLELPSNFKFDVIFIDGLHLADQTERDIKNSLRYLNDDGILILHDCNPPTEFHQREDFYFRNSPAKGFWNGTTWKAFYKFRHCKELYSICFDTDFGVGIFSKRRWPLFNQLDILENKYFEFKVLDINRKSHLNLVDFKYWKTLLKEYSL